MADLEKYKAGVLSTGFPLEFQVGKAFQRHGWSTINSKYYVDDVHRVAREIDVIAYKVAVHADVEICTAIIISCKKNEKNAWSLIAQERNKKDPNTNWFPLHAWTNQEVLRYVLEKNAWSQQYVREAFSTGFYKTIIHPEDHIFAFQELCTTHGTAKDDKAIYQAVTSLMKAQGYEKASRKKKCEEDSRKRLYNFSLLSVINGELLVAKLNEDFVGDVDASIGKTNLATYIGNYIIDQSEIVARVNFVTFDALDDVIYAFDEMHKYDTTFFQGRIDEYFKDPFTDEAASNVFKRELESRIVRWINMIISRVGLDGPDVDELRLGWKSPGRELGIYISAYEDATFDALNADKKLKERVQSALADLYRYHGAFSFDMDFPF
jgi:hypothetical protein